MVAAQSTLEPRALIILHTRQCFLLQPFVADYASITQRSVISVVEAQLCSGQKRHKDDDVCLTVYNAWLHTHTHTYTLTRDDPHPPLQADLSCIVAQFIM